MKTYLYEDTSTNELKTFDEVKNIYLQSINADLPIDDVSMQLIIETELLKNGSITSVEDSILSWCNDYADENEADRYLSQEERDTDVKDIYECISCRGDYIEELKDNLLKREQTNLLINLETLL